MPITIEDLNDLKRLLEEHPDWQETLARVILTPKTLFRIFKSDPELQAILRAVILGEEFLELPALTREAIQRIGALESVTSDLVQRTGALEETSRDTVQRLSALEETSRDTVQRLSVLEAEVRDLKETSRQTIERLDRVEASQRGLEGRLAGDQYEKRILRSAWRLFNGGDGGSPEDRAVAQRLREWLSANRALVSRIREEDDPYLSDLIWWKQGRVAVVEVSLKVNGADVQRAHARAQTLREAGVDAFPLVMGNEWAHPESRDLAEQLQVAWKVGDDISQEYVEFRRMAD
ncbi:MAG: hypothetical protein CFK49_02270 [Armatimonadetes bacterium JP3_11]|nr:MAG: hypothetical protein CFK49_02270 [Armatimonadetes bacterium JP3_11]RMH08218.1 MAG: hypothetical protein D6697_06650 [Armatimonadota bacterium]